MLYSNPESPEAGQTGVLTGMVGLRTLGDDSESMMGMYNALQSLERSRSLDINARGTAGYRDATTCLPQLGKMEY
jgi:hypothetical protein